MKTMNRRIQPGTRLSLKEGTVRIAKQIPGGYEAVVVKPKKRTWQKDDLVSIHLGLAGNHKRWIEAHPEETLADLKTFLERCADGDTEALTEYLEEWNEQPTEGNFVERIPNAEEDLLAVEEAIAELGPRFKVARLPRLK
jgi:hypothetical protein